MSQPPRREGTLKKWNDERGFGFIGASDDGQDVFVHITAFPGDGYLPTVGEVLTFDIEPDRNGKPGAVRVQRADYPAPAAGGFKKPRMSKGPGGSSSPSSSRGQKWVVLLLLAALAVFAYNRYAKRVGQMEAAAPRGVQSLVPSSTLLELPQTTPAPASFNCDGRKHCSQMRSCQEATFFLKNCPGVQMDGNNDGVPCEQQWCK